MRTLVNTPFRSFALVARPLVFIAAAASFGCTSGTDDSGDGGGTVVIAPVSRDATSKGVTFDAAELSITFMSLRACAADTATLQTRNFPIELFHQPSPRVIFVSAVTDYCAVNLELGPAAASGTLPDLTGFTARFRGTRADGAPFEIKSTLANGFSFTSETILAADKLVLGADLEAWLANVDLDAVTPNDDGTVLVDADDNADALAAFDAAVVDAFALYVDANGDGALSEGELTPVATAVVTETPATN